MPTRKPFAVANWKMAMTVADSLAFIREFTDGMGNAAEHIDIVLCPPYTTLHPVAQVLAGSPVQLGGQNLSAAAGTAHRAEISTKLLANVGCEWILVGHWEVRRRMPETDRRVNEKLQAALQVGLRPIMLVGENADLREKREEAVAMRLPNLLDRLNATQVREMAVVYEPEWTIGVDEPAHADYIANGCGPIRGWIAGAYDLATAEGLRIIHGGSVTPDHVEAFLASPDVDGPGTGRKGRDTNTFCEIVRLIAQTK